LREHLRARPADFRDANLVYIMHFLPMEWCFKGGETMNKTAKAIGVLAISACAVGAGLKVARAADLDKVPMTLTGCVVAGEAPNSFLLTNTTVDGPVPHNVFYRFDSTKELKNSVGKRVEVQGYAELDDMDKGKVQVKAKDGKVETKVTSERKTVKVPEDVWIGSMGAVDKAKIKAGVATYKLHVESVKRLEGNCSHAM
jgi:hypothetical protein